MNANRVLAGVFLSAFLAWPAAAQVPSVTPAIVDVPVVGSILDHRQELELSTDQVTALERLAADFMRETIRRQADLALARIDLEGLLGQDADTAVDLSATEAKLRELERIRTDLDVALIRMVETARAGLTPAQRAKFLTLMGEPSVQSGSSAPVPPNAPVDPPDPPRPSGAIPSAARASGSPPPGRVPPRGPAGHAPPPPHRPSFHGGVAFGFWAPFWWEPYWWDYPAAPVVVPPPPVYVPPAPAPTYWYYCSSANAYYPYVPRCPEAWIVVPATPQ